MEQTKETLNNLEPQGNVFVEFNDDVEPDTHHKSYIVNLETARNIPAVSWEKSGMYLTLKGYWYFFNRARDMKIGVNDFLSQAGFTSILAKNKDVEDPYDRLTLWVSPDNNLITRKEYSKQQYLAKKEGKSVKDHLRESGYFRLTGTETKNKPEVDN